MWEQLHFLNCNDPWMHSGHAWAPQSRPFQSRPALPCCAARPTAGTSASTGRPQPRSARSWWVLAEAGARLEYGYGRLRRQLRKVFLRWRAGGGRGTSATLSVCGRSPRLCRLTQGCTLNLPRDAHHSDRLLTRPPAFLPLIVLAGQPLPGERGRQGGHPLHTCRRRGPHPHGKWAHQRQTLLQKTGGVNRSADGSSSGCGY